MPCYLSGNFFLIISIIILLPDTVNFFEYIYYYIIKQNVTIITFAHMIWQTVDYYELICYIIIIFKICARLIGRAVKAVMNSKNELIKYVEITEENIMLATQIELSIFPKSCGYISFERAYKKGDPYFLVYYDGKAIGTTGLYEDEKISSRGTVWLGWFGILPEYRGKGLGKRVLSDTIAEAAARGYSVFRLYTSAVSCATACKLYDAVMDFGEFYTREEPELMRKVYTKSLDGNSAEKWNNRNLMLGYNRGEEDEALKKYNARLKSCK